MKRSERRRTLRLVGAPGGEIFLPKAAALKTVHETCFRKKGNSEWWHFRQVKGNVLGFVGLCIEYCHDNEEWACCCGVKGCTGVSDE